ncbi:MAG: hypothetical protein LBV22_03625 [Mycoplasmataceae bacterium]|jgi:hypothetical protein|nr:hypothetical protein [Mycoplasmataceae bacterium]
MKITRSIKLVVLGMMLTGSVLGATLATTSCSDIKVFDLVPLYQDTFIVGEKNTKAKLVKPISDIYILVADDYSKFSPRNTHQVRKFMDEMDKAQIKIYQDDVIEDDVIDVDISQYAYPWVYTLNGFYSVMPSLNNETNTLTVIHPRPAKFRIVVQAAV